MPVLHGAAADPASSVDDAFHLLRTWPLSSATDQRASTLLLQVGGARLLTRLCCIYESPKRADRQQCCMNTRLHRRSSRLAPTALAKRCGAWRRFRSTVADVQNCVDSNGCTTDILVVRMGISLLADKQKARSTCTGRCMRFQFTTVVS
jgi:hypothetical protein